MKKIVQITDSHLGNKPGDTLLSMNADESLGDVLTLIREQQTAIDLVLCTGDIANNAKLSAYERFYNLVDQHLQTPMAWVPGNHDHADFMGVLVKHSNHLVVPLGEWAVILLDSHVIGHTYGRFNAEELLFLEKSLAAHRDKHILIAFHHQPVPVGSEWMDRYIIQNADRFWQTTEAFTNIKAVIWGHVHQAFDQLVNDVRLLSTPSTCIQFKPHEKDFTVDTLMPGYRWLELHDDGTLNTGIERVAEKDYGIDFASSGY